MFIDNYEEYFTVAEIIPEIHAKKNIPKKYDLDKDKETISEILDKNYSEDIHNNNDYINNINNNIDKNEKEENYFFIESENVEKKIKNLSEKKKRKLIQKKARVYMKKLRDTEKKIKLIFRFRMNFQELIQKIIHFGIITILILIMTIFLKISL